MRIVLFCHSLISDWNHGNAHFLRGITAELQARGHYVDVYEPADGWSLSNLLTEYGPDAVAAFHTAFPNLESRTYTLGELDLDRTLDGAHLVLVHEWNEPSLVARIGAHRRRSGRYQLFFHDTHHRTVTDPDAMSRYDLNGYDGVLAFGNSVAEEYRKRGWGQRVWTWHEAADTRVFRPANNDGPKRDLVWIGNWGDDERTAELREFLMDPVLELGLSATVHGVRYPDDAIARLRHAGIQYRGWIANHLVPKVFAAHKLTVHVPRRPYATALRGVPTIRMFEALACAMPLVSAPWSDDEGLFRPGEDFLFAKDGAEMTKHLRTLLADPEQAASIAESGRQTVLSRHTCAHRVDELMTITESLRATETTVGGPA